MVSVKQLDQEIGRVTEAIHKFFAVKGDLDEEDVQTTHDVFVDCITMVNQRLRHCDELLRKGLVAEALQECESEIDLLDLVTALDIPEWDAWADYVRQFGIPPQPLLLIDVAGELNDAYGRSQSLDEVLSMHRLLALARSPLVERLSVLRRIAERDPENHVWQEDIRSFEQARLTQISDEVQKHVQEDNLHGVAGLRKEIESEAWLDPLPPGIVERVVASHQQLLREHSKRQLENLVNQIDSAFSNFDVEAGLQLRSRWQEVAQTAELDAEDPLSLSVQQAFEWLDQELLERNRQESLTTALVDFEDALDDPSANQETLTRLLAVVERFDEPIPERLTRRYSQRIRAIESGQRRRSVLIVTTSVFALLLVAVGIVAFLWWKSQLDEVKSLVTILEQAVTSGDYDAGLRAYENAVINNPELAKDTKVQVLHGELEQEQEDDEHRARRISDHIEAALRLIRENPDSDDIKAAKSELNSAKTKFKELRSPAPEQENELVEADRSIKQASQKLQSSIDEEFRQALEPINAALRRLEKLSKPRLLELRESINNLKKKKGVSAEARQVAALDLKAKKIESRLEAIRVAERLSGELSTVVQSVGDVSEFRQALQNYADQNPNGSRAASFRRVLQDDAAQLSKLKSWNSLVEDWSRCRGNLEAEAVRADATIQSLESKFKMFPGVASIVELKPYVASLKQRPSAVQNILKLFDHPLFRTNAAQSRSGALVYFLEIEKAVNDTAGEAYVVPALTDSSDLSKTKNTRLKGTDYSDSPLQDLAKESKKYLKRTPVTYERKASAILHLVLNREDLDPICRTVLVRELMPVFSSGSSLLEEQWKPLRLELEKHAEDANELNWLDNMNAKVNETRISLKLVLSDLKSKPKELYSTAIKTALDVIHKKPRGLEKIDWCGVLLIDGSGRWVVRTSSSVASKIKKGPLYVFISRARRLELQRIGEWDGIEFRVDEANELYAEGRPVLQTSSK